MQLTGKGVFVRLFQELFKRPHDKYDNDENGVKAAAYIEFPSAGAAQPPEEIIDFVLDRPFVFVISKGNLPLFTGVVNNI